MNNTAPDFGFNAAGRFGRLSFLGWNGLIFLIFTFAVMIAFALVPGFSPEVEQGMPLSGLLLLVIMYLALIYFSFIFAIRRLHDRGHSGWLSLLMLVPALNIAFGLYLIFAKGDAHENQFGLPRITQTWEKVLAWIYILILPLGILAAIALPAYQDYVQRAQQSQVELQRPAE